MKKTHKAMAGFVFNILMAAVVTVGLFTIGVAAAKWLNDLFFDGEEKTEDK